MSDGAETGFAGDGTNQTPVGLTGTVVTPTRGKDGPGEVALRIRGGTEVFIAWSEEPLPRGERVLCLQDQGGRTVVVAPWEDHGAPWAAG